MENLPTTEGQNLPTKTLLSERALSLLRNERIDWSGKLVFTEDGMVDTRASEDNGAFSINLAALPIPKISESGIAEVSKSKEILLTAMTPCTKNEFATIITRLSLHCGMQQKDDKSIKSMLRDYWDDFGFYPKILIEDACSQWRRSTEEKAKFMPKSGDMIAMMYVKNFNLNVLLNRCKKLLGEPVDEGGNKRPVSNFQQIADILK